MVTFRETSVEGLDIRWILTTHKGEPPEVLAAIIQAYGRETAARIQAEAISDSFGVYSSSSFTVMLGEIAGALRKDDS